MSQIWVDREIFFVLTFRFGGEQSLREVKAEEYLCV